MTTNSENIIGLFVEPAQADAAIAELEAHGFSPYHIRSSDEQHVHGFLAHIKKIFKGHAHTTSDEAQDITELNIRHEDVRFYEHEIASGHVVVALNSDKNVQEAIDILQKHNAMTNYPLALYTSSHNEVTDPAHISETANSANEQTSTYASTAMEPTTITDATDGKNNTNVSGIQPAPRHPKPPIHAQAKRMRNRSSQVQKTKSALS